MFKEMKGSEPWGSCMSPSIVIRKYSSDDIGEIGELFYHTVHTVNAGDYTAEQLNAWADGNINYEEWDKSFKGHYSVVAMVEGRIAAFGDIDDKGYLDRLYVHKDCQGLGAGSEICQRLEDYARQLGNTMVISHVSITAKPFFERRGYAAIKDQTVERRGILLKNYVMRKEFEGHSAIPHQIGKRKDTIKE